MNDHFGLILNLVTALSKVVVNSGTNRGLAAKRLAISATDDVNLIPQIIGI